MGIYYNALIWYMSLDETRTDMNFQQNKSRFKNIFYCFVLFEYNVYYMSLTWLGKFIY